MSENKGGAETSQPVVTVDSSNIIKVTVETLKQEEQFVVDQRSTIQEFKAELGKRFRTSPDLLVLAFAGEILKDQDTLIQHRVHSGVKIHLVIRSQKSPQDGLADQEWVASTMQPPSHSNSSLLYSGSRAAPQNPRLIPDSWSELLTSSQETVAWTMENLWSMILRSGQDVNTINNNAFLLEFVLGMTGVHLLGLDSADVSDLESSIPKQCAPIHSLSPSEENVLHSADPVRDLLMSDPQIQQLAEEYPEIAQIFADPHTFRELLEAFSSPAVMQEVMKIHDVAMRNLESIPGGYGVLERLYREVEEPILDTVQAQLDNNPFASLNSDPPPSGARLPAHTENRRPLPNPWSPQPRRARDQAGHCDGQFASSSASGGFVWPSLGSAVGAGGPNAAGQLTADPELMRDLACALTSPNSPAQRLLNGAGVPSAGNPPPRHQRAQRLPPAGAELSSLLGHPGAQQAWLQGQRGSLTLPTHLPDSVIHLRDSQAQPDLESVDDSAQSHEDDGVFMSGEDESGGLAEVDEEAPQTRFRRQLEQLSAMGFRDHSANLRALLAAEGEINAAVKVLTKAPASDKRP